MRQPVGRGWTRTRRRSVLCAVAAAMATALLVVPAAGAADPVFADWATTNSTVATGTLDGASVSLSGTRVGTTSDGTVLNDTATDFAGSFYTPSLAQGDKVVFAGIASGAYTLTFGRATTDPVLHLG